jgi:2-keto-4-pentenoate hydratase/2-oxohepta-3-ene-1,7-dioic acid hydratase in catechol pathway
MNYVRFKKDGLLSYGIIEDQMIQLIEGDLFSSFHITQQYVHLSQVHLAVPTSPTKIVCVGMNYHDHAQELGVPVPTEPLLFQKPLSSLIAHEQQIIYPSLSKQVDYEAELAIVIRKEAKHITAKDAPSYILGYTCANDVTARDLQSMSAQWTICKGFDTFCPIGPVIRDDIDPHNLKIQSILNGEVKQDSHTSSLIFDCFFLVSYISNIMTLFPGDVILTGTSGGIGPMNRGDTIEIVIEGVGTLVNDVV